MTKDEKKSVEEAIRTLSLDINKLIVNYTALVGCSIRDEDGFINMARDIFANVRKYMNGSEENP